MNPALFVANLVLVLLAGFGAASLAILALEVWRERKAGAEPKEPERIGGVCTSSGRVPIPRELSRAVSRIAHEDALELLNAYALGGESERRELLERVVSAHRRHLEETQGVPTPETLRRWLDEGNEGGAVQRG